MIKMMAVAALLAYGAVLIWGLAVTRRNVREARYWAGVAERLDGGPDRGSGEGIDD